MNPWHELVILGDGAAAKLVHILATLYAMLYTHALN